MVEINVFLIYSIIMPTLYWVTFAVNLLGLVLALWLGIYLVSRNPRLLIAWLTALTLWSLAGVFLNVLLALNPPPKVLFQPNLIRYLFLFWPAETLTESRNYWLKGWSVAPAVVFWHHVTILMLPGELNSWRLWRIWLSYLLAIIAIIAQATASILYSPKESNPLFINSLQAGSLYPYFILALILLTLACLFNLHRSAQSASSTILRGRFQYLSLATLIAGAIAPVSIAGSLFGLPIPMVVISLLIAVPVSIIGYDVARYSAMMEGRTIRRDFLYNLIMLALVVLVYLSASALLVRAYQAPQAILVFVPVLAVITHALMSTAGRLLDRLFFRKEEAHLRSNLQSLMRLAGEGENLDENLEIFLEPLCNSVRATYGLILLQQEDTMRQAAAWDWYRGEISLKPAAFAVDDVIHLVPGQLESPLDEAALLIPFYAGMEQLGALVLGRPVNGIRYSEDDVAMLLNLTDPIGETVAAAYHKIDEMAQIAKLVEPPPNSRKEHPVPLESVEAALRNIFDYSYLADTSLAKLKLVDARLPAGSLTHLERGKAVHQIMVEAIDKLCPDSEVPRSPPSREWYPYLILHDAYLEEVSNREIMLRLYISEGTFNRTRRAAIRSLARALGEMEYSFI
jgi:hypothetical protein